MCEPAGIQTPSLLIRSQMLYSVKLQALFYKMPTNLREYIVPPKKRPLATVVKKPIFGAALPSAKPMIMIRSVFVLLLCLFCAEIAQAQEKKKIARPDLPGSFIFDFGFNRGRKIPANFSQGFWGSRTVNFYYQYPIRFGRTKFSFVPAIGLSLERFKLVNDYTLNNVKDPDGTFNLVPANPLYPGTYKSMIVTNYFEVPVGFRFDTHPEDISRSVSFTAGGRVGILYDAFTKVTYNQDGETKTIKDKQMHGLNQFRYGLYSRFGIGGFNFFYFYNLSPYFAKNKGPQSTIMNTYTIGISISGF